MFAVLAVYMFMIPVEIDSDGERGLTIVHGVGGGGVGRNITAWGGFEWDIVTLRRQSTMSPENVKKKK